MSEPVFSPDGQYMWTGSEWIPAPPESEPSTNNVDHNQKDLNLSYKILALLVSVSTFFVPYLGSYSPFSIFFNDESFLLDEVKYSNFLPIEVFLIFYSTYRWFFASFSVNFFNYIISAN